jgi:ribosomal protein L9
MQAKSKADTKIQVLLKEVVEGVGKKNEVVKVNSGYYNNFLRPKNLASIISDEGVQEKLAKEKVRKLHRPSAYTSRSTDFFSRMCELML